MAKNNEITLEQVSAIVEKIARDRKVTPLEITVRETKAGLGRGNDGYVAAHLQTIKIEYAHAMLLGEKQISHRLNAALYDEIKRFADNSREVAEAGAAVTQQMFNEVCEANSKLEEALATKEQEKATLNRDHEDQVRELTSSLHAVQTEKGSLEMRFADARDRADKSEKELIDVRAELATMTVKQEQVQKDRDDLQVESNELKARLLKTDEGLAQLRDTATKAEQRAELLTWKNDEINRQNEELRQKLDLATERAAAAEAQLNLLKSTSGNKSTKTARKPSSATSQR